MPVAGEGSEVVEIDRQGLAITAAGEEGYHFKVRLRVPILNAFRETELLGEGLAGLLATEGLGEEFGGAVGGSEVAEGAGPGGSDGFAVGEGLPRFQTGLPAEVGDFGGGAVLRQEEEGGGSFGTGDGRREAVDVLHELGQSLASLEGFVGCGRLTHAQRYAITVLGTVFALGNQSVRS